MMAFERALQRGQIQIGSATNPIATATKSAASIESCLVTRARLMSMGEGKRTGSAKGVFPEQGPLGQTTATPQKLRLKAIELRAVANTLSNPTAREDLMDLACRYDRMADAVEGRKTHQS